MTRFETALFLIIGGLAFLAFFPGDSPEEKIASGLGVLGCSVTALVLLARDVFR